MTVIDWAYETTPDTAIMAGALPVAGVPGDFDGNGVVDGLDFLLWQRDNNVVDLADWENNYGASPLPAVGSAVPKPGSTALLSLGLLALGSSGLRLHRKTQ